MGLTELNVGCQGLCTTLRFLQLSPTRLLFQNMEWYVTEGYLFNLLAKIFRVVPFMGLSLVWNT